MTNSDKRQRHKDGHRSKMEEQRIAEEKARRTRLLTIVAGLIVLIVVGIAVVSITSDDSDETLLAGDDTSTTVAETPTDPATGDTSEPGAPVVVEPPAPGASIDGETPCPAADGSAERTTSFAQAPPTCIDPAKTYTAVVTTSEGDITLALDAEQSPIAVNNFVVLSRYHFFDGIPFHRIVTGFVDQTGDPEATGSGGPGYDLPDEEPTRPYEAGDVAMARSATVSGSQLFFTIDPEPLNGTVDSGQPAYPILGRVTAGQDIVELINTFGTADGAGTPTKVVTIDSVAITEA